MKVIGAGMSKTGTKSMHAALEKLGYSVHDYPDAFEHFETEYESFHDQGWTTSDFRRMYENIDAVVDGPACYYWEELVDAFPNAKIVLMIRDNENDWLGSFANLMSLLSGLFQWIYPRLSPSYRRMMRFLGNSACLGFGSKRTTGFETSFASYTAIGLKQAYRRHIAHVKNKCPTNQLLIFNCKEGWEPLCEFLDKPVPDEPFPKLNVGGEQAKLLWELDIMKHAKKEVRIGISIITLSLALSSYALAKSNIFRFFWR